MSFFVALRKELLEQRRTYRLLMVVVVLTAFGLLSPLTARFMPELFKMLPGGEQFAQLIPAPAFADAVGQYVKNISQFGVILALLLAMGAVAQERDKGTLAMVLAKPLSRGALLAAKFAALAVTFAVGMALAGLGAYYYTYILFQAPPVIGWLAATGLILLYTLVFVALTLFFSTLTKSQAVAGGLGVAAVLLFSLIGVLPMAGPYLPDRMLSWGAGLALGTAAIGSPLSGPTAGGAAWPALYVSVGIIVVALFAAWLAFRRTEI